MNTKTLDVLLPSGSLYVSGTVNGVATTWTNMGNNTWQTVAESSPNYTYFVELTIIDNRGLSNTLAITLYDGLHLVTDRTIEDVNIWKALREKSLDSMTDEEKAQWSRGKGAYNYEDLNRVEGAVFMLANRMKELGVHVPVLTKTDWGVGDAPTESDLKRYFENLAKLRASSSGFHLSPTPPKDADGFDYVAANTVEEMLRYIDIWTRGAKNQRVCAGEIFGGEL